MLNKLIVLTLLFALVGCSHAIHLVHMSDFATGEKITSGKMVEATGEQFVVLGFASETDYVNQAKAQLIAKCRKGDIQGIQTRYSTSHGFMSYTNKIYMQGLCLR